jgi:hypothetical protein
MISSSCHGRVRRSAAQAIPGHPLPQLCEIEIAVQTFERRGNGWPVQRPLRYGLTGHDE